MLFVILIIYQLLMIPYYQVPSIINIRDFLDTLVMWILISLNFLIHFFHLSYRKFSPTLILFLKRELRNLGFEIQHKYKTGLFFFLFNSFSVIILVIVNIGIYYSTNDLATLLIRRLFVIYIFSSITIPILRGILHDKFLINLKTPYFVQITFQFKLIKHKEVESQMIRIYMTSNKICSKSNQPGFNLHKEISERRWLPRKRSLIFRTLYLSPNLYFHEYSTPINFKEHFLNIVSAVREWDNTYKKGNH